MATQASEESTVNTGRRRLSGTVVSNSMEKSAVVMVERTVKHPRYHKYVKRRNKFMAHDAENACSVGDKVVIEESRPLSRRKRWVVIENQSV
jgi:small subunit ribosomal protein S17